MTDSTKGKLNNLLEYICGHFSTIKADQSGLLYSGQAKADLASQCFCHRISL